MSLISKAPGFSGITSYILVFQLVCFPTLAQNQPAPAALSIVILEGEGAINSVRQRIAREPVVQVEDENHKPVAGAAVTFLMPNQGAGATFANGAKSLTVLTDDKGQAIARSLKPNNINGQYQIRVNASYHGQTASTNITQSTSITATTGVSTTLLVVIAAAGAAVAGGVYAGTRGSGKQAPTAITITPGSPSAGVPQ